MGLDAIVRCNCITRDKIPDRFLDGLEFDPEWGFQISDDAYEDFGVEFETWKSTACVHQHGDGIACQERIGNVWGLEEIGKFFASSRVRLDAIFDGIGREGKPTSPDQARLMLAEIQKLKQADSLGDVWVVVDWKGGEIMSYGADSHAEKVFGFYGDHRFVCVDDRFEIRDTEKGLVLFSSAHFTQRLHDPEGTHFLLTDLASGATCVFREAVSTAAWNGEEVETVYPSEVRIIRRPRTFADLCSMTALEKLCEASLETGNPICFF